MSLNKALNRLAKWRTVFAGWQLGTRQIGDPESDAVRDHREATLMMRAELTTLIGLLTSKGGVITRENFEYALEQEAIKLEKDLQARFPGFKATDQGISVDFNKARVTMKGWKP